MTPNGNAVITWYDILDAPAGYNDPNDLPNQEYYKMQGSVRVGGKNYYWANGKWNESRLSCAYANSQHCVYPYEVTPNGYVFTGAVSPNGDIPVGNDQFIYIQVSGTDPRLLNDPVFGDGGELVNTYDGCPACIPNGGVDLLSTSAYSHYGLNGSGISAEVYIWVWIPSPALRSNPSYYRDRELAR